MEKVNPKGQVVEAAMELAAKIKNRGPLVVASTKRVMNENRDLSLQPALELESDMWAALAKTEDMKEGARSFLEKRKPEYKGK